MGSRNMRGIGNVGWLEGSDSTYEMHTGRLTLILTSIATLRVTVRAYCSSPTRLAPQTGSVVRPTWARSPPAGPA
jgi:hypothetical protein